MPERKAALLNDTLRRRIAQPDTMTPEACLSGVSRSDGKKY